MQSGAASLTGHYCPCFQNCVELFQRTQIRFIRRAVTRPFLQSLVVSLVLSRLDYGNAALAGLPTRQLSRLQSVQNGGARLIFRQTSTITFHRYYVTFTGCGRRSESTTRLPFSCIGVCTDLLRRTCLLIYGASRTCRRDSDYGHCHRTC